MDPNDDSDVIVVEPPRLITPKITIKPIPKPVEKMQPLEVITAPHSPFRVSENESQQSPRIILKINKNATSQTTEAIILTKPSTSMPIEVADNDHNAANAAAAALVSSTTMASAASVPTAIATTPHQNDLKRGAGGSVPSQVDPKKLKFEDDIQVLSSDSDSDLPNHLKNFRPEKPRRPSQSSLITDYFNATSKSAESSNSQLAMALLGHKNAAATDASAANETDKSSDNARDGALINDKASNNIGAAKHFEQKATTEAAAATTKSSATGAATANDKPNSKLNWSSFYDREAQESPPAVHPLLQHHIERAKLLEAMMNPVQESATADDDKASLIDKKKNELLLMNEDSSSDCIVVEDTGSDPLSEFTQALAQNGEKKDSSGDRDSGVDVSNSIKSVGNDEEVTPAKRPRGRPRKDGTPAGSIK